MWSSISVEKKLIRKQLQSHIPGNPNRAVSLGAPGCTLKTWIGRKWSTSLCTCVSISTSCSLLEFNIKCNYPLWVSILFFFPHKHISFTLLPPAAEHGCEAEKLRIAEVRERWMEYVTLTMLKHGRNRPRSDCW